MKITIKRPPKVVDEQNGVALIQDQSIVGELSDSDIVAIVERYNSLYTNYLNWLKLNERGIERGYIPALSFKEYIKDRGEENNGKEDL